MYYNKEQKEKDDALVKLHKEFAPVLQVLLHTALQTLQEPDDTVSADTRLSECESSTSDLCQMLFDFLAKLSCTLVESSSRRSQVYLSLNRPALASLPELNPSWPWLLPSGTI